MMRDWQIVAVFHELKVLPTELGLMLADAAEVGGCGVMVSVVVNSILELMSGGAVDYHA